MIIIGGGGGGRHRPVRGIHDAAAGAQLKGIYRPAGDVARAAAAMRQGNVAVGCEKLTASVGLQSTAVGAVNTSCIK